jgi:hypothetical protein
MDEAVSTGSFNPLRREVIAAEASVRGCMATLAATPLPATAADIGAKEQLLNAGRQLAAAKSRLQTARNAVNADHAIRKRERAALRASQLKDAQRDDSHVDRLTTLARNVEQQLRLNSRDNGALSTAHWLLKELGRPREIEALLEWTLARQGSVQAGWDFAECLLESAQFKRLPEHLATLKHDGIPAERLRQAFDARMLLLQGDVAGASAKVTELTALAMPGMSAPPTTAAGADLPDKAQKMLIHTLGREDLSKWAVQQWRATGFFDSVGKRTLLWMMKPQDVIDLANETIAKKGMLVAQLWMMLNSPYAAHARQHPDWQPLVKAVQKAREVLDKIPFSLPAPIVDWCAGMRPPASDAG